MRKAELLKKLKILEPQSTEQRNSIVCSLIGHSKIRTFFFGYNYCGRCKQELGDSLGGIWKQTVEYIEGHTDEECLNALKNMGWEDKLYVPKKIYSAKSKEDKQ